MSSMIQIRNVPDDLHRLLKSRAALAGLSLSDFLLNELQVVGDRPTLEELRNRLSHRSGANLSISPAQVVREERQRYE
jgi:plasmid stability protein